MFPTVVEIELQLIACYILFFSPYTIACYIAWLLRWHWKFTIKREEYGDEEKAYLIRKKMGLSSMQWDAMEPAQKNEFFSRDLWIESNFQVCFNCYLMA